MASRPLPPLVFRPLPAARAGAADTSSDSEAWAQGYRSPNWSSAGLGSRVFLLLVVLAEVAAVTLAIAGEVGALQA